jgi:hypothetical protein
MGDGIDWHPYITSSCQYSFRCKITTSETIQQSIEYFSKQSTNEVIVNFPSDLEIKDSDTSDYKGFLHEMQCILALRNIQHVTLSTNPTNYYDWSHQKVKRSYDICVTYEDGSKDYIECKYRKNGYRVFGCWYSEDWAPRDCNIYMTNNTEAINYENKRDIDSKHRKLLSHSEVAIAISKKANRIHKKLLGCNQLSSWNSLRYNIINLIQVITSSIYSKIEASSLKVRLKSSLSDLKSSVKARLSKSYSIVIK